jgi:hypothetical protein
VAWAPHQDDEFSHFELEGVNVEEDGKNCDVLVLRAL